MPYWLIFALTLAGCFGAQAFALKKAGGRTLKSESNFFSSVGRIQAGAYANEKIAVLGSSITGRLPDSAQGFAGISNMGCDGGNGIDTLRAIDKGILPTAPWIFIEANTLQLSLDSKPTEISRTMEGLWFQLGIKHPSISAYSRPSAFFYSRLLAKKIGNYSEAEAKRGFGLSTLPTPITEIPAQVTSDAENKIIAEVSEIIQRLHQKNSKVAFVWLPPPRAEDKAPDWIMKLVATRQSSWWDLGQEVPLHEVKLTDSVHMDAVSATRTTGELLRSIQKLDQSSSPEH